MQLRQRVRLHSAEIEDFVVCVSRPWYYLVSCGSSMFFLRDGRLTSPRRTPKNDRILRNTLQPLLQHIEHIALDPPNLLCHAVDFSITLRTREDHRIFLNSKNLLPASRECKSYRVASRAYKRIDQDGLGLRSCY